MRRRTLALALPCAPMLWGVPARAQGLAAPSGTVVLSVSGTLRLRNAGDRAVFDMAMLEALPQHTITSRTPWYPQPRRFTGPLLRDVLDRVGADGRMLRAIALNDYRVDIPVEDVRRWNVIAARLLDDLPMTVREKGPLFVMYPFDAHPELRTAVYFSRCIWQLHALELL